MWRDLESLHGQVDTLLQHVGERQSCGQWRQVDKTTPNAAIEQDLHH